MDKIKVSSKTMVGSAAGKIAADIKQCGKAEIVALGAGAVNQTVKSICLVRKFMEPETVVCEPNLSTVEVDGEMRTSMEFTVYTLEKSA